MIFNLITALLIVFTIYYIVNTNRKGYVISLHYLLTLCFFIFICIVPLLMQPDIVRDEGFNVLIAVAFIGLICSLYLVPYDIASPFTINYEPITWKFEINKKFLSFGFYVYLVYMVYGILAVIQESGSIAGVFLTNRLEGGLGVNYLAGNLFPLLMKFFKYIYFIKIFFFFTNNKKYSFYFFYVIPIIHHQFTAITRFDFVVMVTVLLLVLIDAKRLKKRRDLTNVKKVNTTKMILWSIPVIIITLFYMRTANYVRSGFFSESKSSSLVNTDVRFLATSALSDLNYYNAMFDLTVYDSEPNSKREYGLSWFYYPLINFIPRQIWPNKPLTAFSPRFTEKVYWKIGPGRPVATFTIFGEGYMQFGLLGVFLAPILFVYTRYYSIKYIKRFAGSSIVVYLIIFSMMTYFRGEQPIFHVVTDIGFFKIIEMFSSIVASER